MARIRWVRTIVIEGEEAAVRANRARAWLPDVDSTQEVVGMTAICTASYEIPGDACRTCEGRGYAAPADGCVAERCDGCGGTGKEVG